MDTEERLREYGELRREVMTNISDRTNKLSLAAWAFKMVLCAAWWVVGNWPSLCRHHGECRCRVCSPNGGEHSIPVRDESPGGVVVAQNGF